MLPIEKTACRVLCVLPGSSCGYLKLYADKLQLKFNFNQKILSFFTTVCVFEPVYLKCFRILQTFKDYNTTVYHTKNWNVFFSIKSQERKEMESVFPWPQIKKFFLWIWNMSQLFKSNYFWSSAIKRSWKTFQRHRPKIQRQWFHAKK